MDIKELDRQAKQGFTMPSGLRGYEQAYYIAARGLYQQYAKGELTLEDARKEKEQVLGMYKQGEEEWAYLMRLHHIDAKLKVLKEEGFNTILEMEILALLEHL
ncbi:MAG: hypothetical protein ACRDDX_07735 [Cellulosilyticaceae bacterium]